MRSLPARVSGRVCLAASGAVLAAAVLSGCGVAGTSFNPGVAVRVGDQVVTTDEVDRTATGACDAFEKQLVDQNQVVPMSVLKSFVVQSLASNQTIKLLGEQYDVKPGDQYRRAVASFQANAVDLSTSEYDAALLVNTSEGLASDILGQVGAKISAESGVEVDGASPSAASDEAIAAGNDAYATFLSKHPVEVDPEYGISISATGIKVVDTGVSFPVSPVATTAIVDPSVEPTKEQLLATMQLPATQRCGRFADTGAPATP